MQHFIFSTLLNNLIPLLSFLHSRQRVRANVLLKDICSVFLNRKSGIFLGLSSVSLTPCPTFLMGIDTYFARFGMSSGILAWTYGGKHKCKVHGLTPHDTLWTTWVLIQKGAKHKSYSFQMTCFKPKGFQFHVSVAESALTDFVFASSTIWRRKGFLHIH